MGFLLGVDDIFFHKFSLLKKMIKILPKTEKLLCISEAFSRVNHTSKLSHLWSKNAKKQKK